MITTQQFKILLAQYANVTEADASAFVDALLQTVMTRVKQGEPVTIQGLGTFRILDSQQGELRRLAFECDEKLKEAVNAPFSFFEPMVIERPKVVENSESSEISEDSEDSEHSEISENSDNSELSEQPQPEQPQPQPQPEPEQPSPKRNRWDMVNIVLALVACVLLWYLFGANPQTPQPMEHIPDAPVVLADSAAGIQEQVADTMAVPVQPADTTIVSEQPADTVKTAPANTELPAETANNVPAEPAQASIKPESSIMPEPEERPAKPTPEMLLHENGAPRMVSLSDGERLTLIAEREYGDKTFWCYIFDVNAYRLSDPECVPKDVPLYLPDPSYFNIDADDPASVRKARNHGAKLLKPKQ